MKKMDQKRIAGEKAVEFITDGMTIGLGTGSTVTYTIHKVAELIKDGMVLKCVSTSSSTTRLADSLGIKLVPFDDVKEIALTIDGADEVDNQLNGIKGGGGALLFEKLVAKHSLKNIWVVDSSKFVKQLGKFPLPVEVVKFAAKKLFGEFKEAEYNPEFRMNGKNFYQTDSGNMIIDLHLNKIEQPAVFEKLLKGITGVVDCGLFIGIADLVIIGNDNEVQIIQK
jgi:ribose 5-phosphate isomerase A